MRKETVRYNTNLAAEFWVLSALCRLGVEANLTLGNKKSVDIVILREGGDIFTVDVKGLAGPYYWPADNIKVLNDPSHFYVMLSFEGKIGDPLATPSVWVVPSDQLKPFIRQFRTRSVVSRTLMKRDGGAFKDAWWRLSHLTHG